MKKKLIIGVIIPLIAIIGLSSLLLLSNDKTVYHIIITESTWDEYGTSKNTVTELDIEKNGTIYNGNNKQFTFNCKRIKSQVIIKTSTPFSQRKDEKSSINLTDTNTEFILKKGDIIILDTPTLDSGETYKFEFKGY